MVTIIKTMVTIINKMTTVTIINKMTKSKWSFASVHEKRYSSYLFHCQKMCFFIAICTNRLVLKLRINKHCNTKWKKHVTIPQARCVVIW